jgi:hypothetical protein
MNNYHLELSRIDIGYKIDYRGCPFVDVDGRSFDRQIILRFPGLILRLEEVISRVRNRGDNISLVRIVHDDFNPEQIAKLEETLQPVFEGQEVEH